jgi:tRNA threonylcarbamoyladenosine biosynthesis protein TsaE
MCGRLQLEGLFMERFISKSPADTENIGKMVGEKINGGTVIAFRGGLGMGKTCFTRGLARGLGSNDTVTSPTFALVNEYLSGRLPLYHFDMYRISGWEDLYSTSFFEYIDQGGVIAAEWSENIEAALPENTIYVIINKIDDNTREIIIKQKGE